MKNNQIKLLTPLAIADIDYTMIDQLQLGEYRFQNETDFFNDACKHFKGVILLQTCNRVDVIVHGTGTELTDYLHGLNRYGFVLYEGVDAIKHLLSLAAGTKSLIIGEDQVLGQLKDAMLTANEFGSRDPILNMCINTAIHMGVKIRTQTKINHGNVSIGSAAVQLAEEQLEGLDGRNILVVGGGEMVKLVTKSLSEKNLKAIYVTNRTYDRAVKLAQEIGGKAMRMDSLYQCITLSDVVISCTAAPHTVINTEQLRIAMSKRCWPLDPEPKKIVLIDIAQPRDIEETCRDIPGVLLFTIDDLKSISDQNFQQRKSEAILANKMIDNMLDEFIRIYNRTSADDLIASLYLWAESIRVQERDKAIGKLDDPNSKNACIIDDLTRVLTNKLLADVTKSIQVSVESTDVSSAKVLVDAIIHGERICIPKQD
ncbi:MAG TPA: glutamyl-tRNA reductase [Methanocorpusculum sp.]|nr:glutamyl-tRNA reductase [Methanocorpusculum sp.]